MKTVRAITFALHLTVGCVVGLVILAMSVTGVLLAFQRQINARADVPAVLQGQIDSAAPQPLDLILATPLSNGQGVPSELVLHNRGHAPVEAHSLVIAGNRSGKFEIEQTVTTRKGSHTFAVDAANQLVYLPAADFLPATTGWPKVKLGTFGILVLQNL